ncbi:ATP-binding protein [Actinoplanes sp. NPDC026623]|uniref:ATP-binding protein n=1 Tax=Actinoplanes sp. NPDC026623 TaxID=3155610 RepID=UPI0033F72395
MNTGKSGYEFAVPVLRTSRPPTPNAAVAHWVLDSFTELRSLRSSLHKALTGEPLPEGNFLDEVPEKVAIVATELATNALAHARPPTVVELRRTDDEFILDVADEEPGASPEFAVDRPGGAGGLGLQLARDLALDIGWYVDGDAKHVWARFPVPEV